jgi:8-amino-7-oxononanoate synthase
MERIERFLEERRREGLLRILTPSRKRRGGKINIAGREYLDFSSNDYLGLAEHEKLAEASKAATDTFGVGSSASRLLSGDLELHHELEERVASFKGKEATLIFNSGYQANVGIISSLCGRGDCIFSDRLNHASIIDGALLSGAKLFRFNHNDPSHLEGLLKKERANFKESLIVTETIFSMDGDRPPLKEIATLKTRFNSLLMVDEAHATGVFGASGSGVVEEEGLIKGVDLVMGTFGKALGSFGAYVACSRVMREFLINACRGFIYSTALPPSVIAADLAALEVVRDEPFRRISLLEGAEYFRNGLMRLGLEVRGSSQIVPLIVGDVRKAISLSDRLKEAGYWVFPIRPPTVPQGEARLRFSLTYHHTKDVLKKIIDEVARGAS